VEAAPIPSPPLTVLPSQEYIPLPDAPARIQGEAAAPVGQDWSTSFQGLSERPFEKEVAEALLRPLDPEDVEVKPGMSNFPSHYCVYNSGSRGFGVLGLLC
jgi:hypothetical protein